MPVEGKHKILEAARRLIARDGFAAATMRAIAEEAGLSTGAIYHYYKCKEEVLYDVLDEGLSESTRIALKAQQTPEHKAEIIEEISENILKRFDKNEENQLLFSLAHEAMLGDEVLKTKFRLKYQEWVGRTEELIDRLYGKEKTSYTRAFAALLIGAIDGVVMQRLLNANQAEPEEISEVYHQILLKGIPVFMEHLASLPPLEKKE
jgi:AcrR family transcriptional regulator